MRCPICGTYMGTLGNGVCGVCAEKYLHLAPPPSEVERLSAENERLRDALVFIRDHGMTSTKELLVREATSALAAGGK